MVLEIERRFLIKNDNWKRFITKEIMIEQGYLSRSLDDWIIRIRFTGKTLKLHSKNILKALPTLNLNTPSLKKMVKQ